MPWQLWAFAPQSLRASDPQNDDSIKDRPLSKPQNRENSKKACFEASEREKTRRKLASKPQNSRKVAENEHQGHSK